MTFACAAHRVALIRLTWRTPSDFRLNPNVPCSYKFIRGGRKDASQLVLVMVYERQFTYHLWNSYGVLAGIGTVSLANWALPITDVGTRLSLDITLLLVSVAFKQVLNSELPPVSYLTILDRYSLAIIGFVFLATWLHGFVGLLENEFEAFSTEQVKSLDYAAIALYALGFGLYNCWHAALVRTQLFAYDRPLHFLRMASMELPGCVRVHGLVRRGDARARQLLPSLARQHEVRALP